MITFLLLVFSLPFCCSPASAASQSRSDRDHDGLDDAFEQEILERFRPALRLHERECDRLPAEFLPDVRDPRPLAANGTLYGQVFPLAPPSTTGSFVEVHYYHLWANDCGRFGHGLDTEYVSGLIVAQSFDKRPEQWQARYWFAAAHEGTPCDMSNAAPAEVVGAIERGPDIWVSRGKHASFLSRELCDRLGCGGDQCGGTAPMEPGRIVNIGEPGYPLNGAGWAQSNQWSLETKMVSDYHGPRLEKFASLRAVSVVHDILPPTRSFLLAGNETIGALENSSTHAGRALIHGSSGAGKAVARALAAVGLSLRAAGRFRSGDATSRR